MAAIIMKGFNGNLQLLLQMGIYNYHHYLPYYKGMIGVICVFNLLKI